MISTDSDFQSYREAQRKAEEETANAQIKAAVDLDRPPSQRRQFPGSIPSDVLESIGGGLDKGKKRQRDDDNSIASRYGQMWGGLDIGISDSTARSSNEREPDIDPSFSYAHRRKIQRLESVYNPAAAGPSGSHISPMFDQPNLQAPQPDDESTSTATQVPSVPELSEAHSDLASPIFSENNSQAPQPSNGTNSTTSATQVAEPTPPPTNLRAAPIMASWLHGPRPHRAPKSGPA